MRRVWYSAEQIGPGGCRRAQLVDERALLAEERAAETRDERCQDLALVDVASGRSAEPRARLAASRRAVAAARSARGVRNCS